MDANLFCEGSIYYYENDSRTKKDYNDTKVNHDFLVSRPVYVINSAELPFDTFTVNILPVTSSDNRVGIPINITGLKNGKILPYAIHSVHKEYLKRFMGRASDEIIEEVRSAIKYHNGFTDEKPEYILNYEKKKIEEAERLANMSNQERVLLKFIAERCIYNKEYYSSFDELFRVYIKYAKEHAYSRPQTFSRFLQKNLNPSVYREVKNGVIYFYGISLAGDVHKVNASRKTQQKDDRVTYKKVTNRQTSTGNSSLSSKSMNNYKKLDIIQKTMCYSSNNKMLELLGIDIEDAHIVRDMIRSDVDKRKERIFNELRNGKSPFNFNTIDQSILYYCTDDELKGNIAQKHIKRGGIQRIRRLLLKEVRPLINNPNY